MPQFKYKAVSVNGGNISGEYEAANQSAVVGLIRQNGYYPLEIVQLSSGGERATKRKIKMKPLAAACTQIAAMLRAGVPVAKTFEILKDQTEDKPLSLILGDVHKKIQMGISLTEAFSVYRDNLPPMLINMIEAGEASGAIDTCMARAGTVFSRNAKLSGKIKAAMVYPALLLTLMILIAAALLIFVIPIFVTLFEQNNATLPFLTRLLVGASDFVQYRWFLIILSIAIVVVCWYLFINTDAGRTSVDRLKLRLPAINKLLVKVYAGRYARTLASLSSAGIPLTEALTVTARSVLNRYVEKKLYAIVEELAKGEKLSDNLEMAGVMPVMIVYLTRLGEESGTMDSLLLQAADFYDEESEAALQALTALVEPVMIIIMALVLLPVILAVILPVYGMYSLVG